MRTKNNIISFMKKNGLKML